MSANQVCRSINHSNPAVENLKLQSRDCIANAQSAPWYPLLRTIEVPTSESKAITKLVRRAKDLVRALCLTSVIHNARSKSFALSTNFVDLYQGAFAALFQVNSINIEVTLTCYHHHLGTVTAHSYDTP